MPEIEPVTMTREGFSIVAFFWRSGANLGRVMLVTHVYVHAI